MVRGRWYATARGVAPPLGERRQAPKAAGVRQRKTPARDMDDAARIGEGPEQPSATVASSAPGGAAPPPKPPPAAHLAPPQVEEGTKRQSRRTVTAALRELATTEHNGKPLVDLLAERFMKEALSGKFTLSLIHI